jgi:predicted metal-dependent hydrolase
MEIYKIIRSSRKSIGLEITRQGDLVVRAPNLVSKKAIQHIINNHHDWIIEKQKIVQEKSEDNLEKRFVFGEEFWFLGEIYKLNISDKISSPLVFDRGFILHPDSHVKAKDVFIKWYKEQARTMLTNRVNYYSSIYGFQFKTIKISSAKGRWGSCSIKGHLNFPWRLVMAPLSVINYVVVHELVHLKIHNHSKMFWDEVYKLFPQYKICKQWLKENGHLLTI